VLATRGLADELAEHAIRRDVVGGHFAGLPVPLDMSPWRTRFPGGLFVPQNRIEQVLEEHLARWLGVGVRRESALTGIEADPEGVTVTVNNSYSVRAQYVVACDGAHSTVRSLLGAEFPGQVGTISAVTADIELVACSPSVPRVVGHISQLTASGGGYWMMLHPLHAPGDDSQLYRVVFGGPEQAALPRTAPVGFDEVAQALVAVHGPETELGRIRWGTRFTDATRQLAQYRHGRVLFAGDAAHIHSPIGGQGLNLGVQDAMNLGWKLAAHVRGTAPDGLLDSYHAERHPIAARVLNTTRAQRVLMAPSPEDLDALALRKIVTVMAGLPDANRYLAGLMSGLDIRYDLGDPNPLVGMRMPDLDLRLTDGTQTRVSMLLHSGRGLLLTCGTGILGGDRVLVRPDGYVQWIGSGAEAPDAARMFGSAVVTEEVADILDEQVGDFQGREMAAAAEL
jgi:2-polyprenyl-6-methoxyphenol hydroxylase-like FAD-dependent oxidoreductase